MTGDRDMYQCAAPGITVLYVRTGGKGAEEVDPDGVRERYGVDPEQVPDFIALRGDPADGLPGAKGVGPKKAAELLQEHGSLEAILDAAIRERRPDTARGAARRARGPAGLQRHRDAARRRRRPAPGPARPTTKARRKRRSNSGCGNSPSG